MPFKSEKQRRYLWANEPEIARDWTDTYGSRIKKDDGGIARLGYIHGGVTHPDGRRGFFVGAEKDARAGKASMSPGTHHTKSGPRDRSQKDDMTIRDYRPPSGSHHQDIHGPVDKVEIKKGSRKVSHLKTNEQKRNLVLAMRKLGLLEGQKFGLWGGMLQGLTGQVPEWAENWTEEELNKVARTGPYLGADDAVTAKQLESGTELLGRVFKGGPFGQKNLGGGGGDGQPDPCKGPNPPAYCFAGTGGGGTTPPPDDEGSDFQDSLTGTADTPNYYVGSNPLASNIAWGKQAGVDPRTMGIYNQDQFGFPTWAAEGGRIPAAYGGIMDTTTGRRAYGFGSFFRKYRKSSEENY